MCRECGTEIPVSPTHVCDLCFGPLDVRYDYAEVARRVSREAISAGPPSIWRYRDPLPVELDGDEPGTPREGLTPPGHPPHLGGGRGPRNLYIKNDNTNPTH